MITTWHCRMWVSLSWMYMSFNCVYYNHSIVMLKCVSSKTMLSLTFSCASLAIKDHAATVKADSEFTDHKPKANFTSLGLVVQKISHHCTHCSTHKIAHQLHANSVQKLEMMLLFSMQHVLFHYNNNQSI